MPPHPLSKMTSFSPHYPVQAYEFVMDALAWTVHQLGQRRHVTGRELCLGARDLALDVWGPLARHVLETWGIRSTDDFGRIVFNLIDASLLAKTDTDKIEDFHEIYSFSEAFDKTYTVQLDDHGHVRRKLPRRPAPWVPLAGHQGMN